MEQYSLIGKESIEMLWQTKKTRFVPDVQAPLAVNQATYPTASALK